MPKGIYERKMTSRKAPGKQLTESCRRKGLLKTVSQDRDGLQKQLETRLANRKVVSRLWTQERFDMLGLGEIE